MDERIKPRLPPDLVPRSNTYGTSFVSWENNYLDHSSEKIHTNVSQRLNSSLPTTERKKRLHYARKTNKFERILVFCFETTLLFTLAIFLSKVARKNNIQCGVVVDLIVGVCFILFFEDIVQILKDATEDRFRNTEDTT